MSPFVEQHQSEINNVLSCFDRVVITGMLPDIGHARAMTGLLGYNKSRVFDDAQWAEPLRNELRSNADQIAGQAGLEIEIEFIRNHKAFRKVYFNGQSWLARQLLRADIPFELADNAFLSIADPKRARHIADSLNARSLHQHLDAWVLRFFPLVVRFRSGYH